MPSQTDLDQGGTFRQFVRTYLGPSVGWVASPNVNVVPITAAGTTTIIQGCTLVTVNIAGLVTVQLPSARSATVPAGVAPGTYLGLPVTVVDVGGHAASFAITILPFGAETIDGLSSITISSAFGRISLYPDIANGKWTYQ